MEGEVQLHALEQIEDLAAADLVVGILADPDQETATTVYEALRTLPGDLRIAILSSDAGSVQADPVSVSAQEGTAAVCCPLARNRARRFERPDAEHFRCLSIDFYCR